MKRLRRIESTACALSFGAAGARGRQCVGRRGLATVSAVAACFFLATTIRAESATDASSSRDARDEAVRAIPWQRLGPEQRRLTQSVINNAGIYRRLPTRVIDCDPEMFTFLVQHPEVIADVWRVMGISRVKLDKLPDGGFRGTDGAGTTGTVRFLTGDWGLEAKNTAVIFADGAYEGKPFMMPLKAQTIALLRSDAIQERNGRRYVTVRADVFIRVEQMAVELVARTVQPWVNATADRNLVETLTFFSNFSRTAEQNPDGMQRLASRLTAIDEPTRRELMHLCYQTAGRYSQVERPRDLEETLIVQQDVPVSAIVK